MADLSTSMQLAAQGMNRPQGGLGAMQGPPPSQQGVPPANIQAQQTTGQAQGAEMFDENVGRYAQASNIGDMEFIKMLQERLQAGLPSSQEIQRSARRRSELLEQTLGMMQPQEVSGFDAAMRGLATPLPRELLMKGFGGSAMAAMGNAAAADLERQKADNLKKSLGSYDLVNKGIENDEAQMVKAMSMRQKLANAGQGKIVPLPGAKGFMVNNVTGEVFDMSDAATQSEIMSTYRTLRADYPTEEAALEAATLAVTKTKRPTGKMTSKGVVSTDDTTVSPPVSKGEPEQVTVGDIGIPQELLSKMSPKDQETMRRVLDRYATTPNEGTRAAVETALAAIVPLMKTNPPTTKGAFPQKTDKAVEAAKKAGAEAQAKADVELNTAAPVAAATKRGGEIGESQGKAQVALTGAYDALNSDIEMFDRLVKMPGFESTVGATMLPGARFVPGSKQADFAQMHNQILDKSFLKAFEILKGGGQITEKEGEKATRAINRLSLDLSEGEYKRAIADYLDAVKSGIKKLEKQAALTTGNNSTGGWSVVK